MFRHPRYVEMPWGTHWQQDATTHHRWWLAALLILAGIFLIGVRATGKM